MEKEILAQEPPKIASLVNCHIQFHGTLHSTWADYVGELALRKTNDEQKEMSVLIGFVRDQSALLGILLYLNQFGASLHSIDWALPARESSENQDEQPDSMMR